MQRIRAKHIAEKALQTRKKFLGASPNSPICPYVLAETMGFDLWYVNIPSLEGIYVASGNLILISAERPEGRKRFTCAHEIGHHVLGHGTVLDEIIEPGSDKAIEKEADYFAGILLMPRLAVQYAISRYGKNSNTLSDEDVYVLSKYFGVSYKAFVTHLHYSLQLIDSKKFKRLKETKLENIRKNLCSVATNNQVIKVGRWWEGKAIDVEVGDVIVSNSDIKIDGPMILDPEKNKDCTVFTARLPGITGIYDYNGWSCFVKISRKKYSGMFQFKYQEDIE